MLVFYENANKAQLRYIVARSASDTTIDSIFSAIASKLPDCDYLSMGESIRAIAITTLDLYGVNVLLRSVNGKARLCAQPATEPEPTHSVAMAAHTASMHYLLSVIAELVEAAINQTTAPTPTGDSRKA